MIIESDEAKRFRTRSMVFLEIFSALRLFRNESFQEKFCKIIPEKIFWKRFFVGSCRELEKILRRNSIAQKWCKEGNSIEDGRVSLLVSLDFHKLINTCVENLMEEKYFFWSSASRVLSPPPF